MTSAFFFFLSKKESLHSLAWAPPSRPLRPSNSYWTPNDINTRGRGRPWASVGERVWWAGRHANGLSECTSCSRGAFVCSIDNIQPDLFRWRSTCVFGGDGGGWRRGGEGGNYIFNQAGQALPADMGLACWVAWEGWPLSPHPPRAWCMLHVQVLLLLRAVCPWRVYPAGTWRRAGQQSPTPISHHRLCKIHFHDQFLTLGSFLHSRLFVEKVEKCGLLNPKQN